MRQAATKPLPVTQNNIAFKVLGNVMERLMEPEKRRLQQRLDRVVDQHEEMMSTGGKLSVVYGGVNYYHSRAPYRSVQNPMLHYQLWDQMEAYLGDQKAVLLDGETIKQTLFKCVFNWRDSQDFRNRMPDCVVPILSDGIQNLHRTVPFEEATCFKERDRRQFEKILPKIELYTTARLIY